MKESARVMMAVLFVCLFGGVMVAQNAGVAYTVRNGAVTLYGGSIGDVPAHTEIVIPKPTDFPDVEICWEHYHIADVGKGGVASLLLVQGSDGSVGVAIRDDVGDSSAEFCTKGFPRITLGNNWTEEQVMTYHLYGHLVHLPYPPDIKGSRVDVRNEKRRPIAEKLYPKKK
jgi:hypothetical protein